MTEFEFAVEAITEDEVGSRVAELGQAITDDYGGRDPLFAVVMLGSIQFAADLVRHVDTTCEIDFMGLNRFGEGGRIGIAVAMTILFYLFFTQVLYVPFPEGILL